LPDGIEGLVSVVVVTWNAARRIDGCLAAIKAQAYRPLELIAVDNGSADGTPARLEAEPGLRLIANSENLGTVAASNQGLEAAKGEFALLLNDDVELAPDYVARLVAAMGSADRVGSAGGKLLRADGRIDSAGHLMYACGWAVNRGQEEPDHGQYDRAEEVFGLSGAAVLYRRAMLDDVAVGGHALDPTLGSYLEDVDVDWRARLRGWRAWYEPTATAVHSRGASGARPSARTQRAILRNRLWIVIKCDGGPGVWRRLPSIAAFTFAKAGQLLFSRPLALMGLWDVVRLLPAALRLRRLVRGARRADDREIERWFLPAWWKRFT
jgi:GT2 family glycosyltransferase